MKFTHSLMQINNLCSNIIMVFLLDFKIFQELQKATLTDCLFCMTKLFSLKPLIMLLYPDLITVLRARRRFHRNRQISVYIDTREIMKVAEHNGKFCNIPKHGRK